MTCYIQPINKPEAIYTIRILRYNPETDDEPHWESYKIPFVSTMTVVEALENLWDQGEYIAFRTNCREFTCGSCAMRINGKPQLACDTLLEDNMTLEPLSRYHVLRDLVVDNDVVLEKLKELQYWPKTDDRNRPLEVSSKVMTDFGQIYSRCIECGCCLEACPASFSESSKFIGPMYTLLLGRAANHPLDEFDRVTQASDCGIWACVNCFECVDVCPMKLEPVKEVTKFRRKAITHTLRHPFTPKQGATI
jgi:succinate dehydrogenase/fumarate reductase iron-sulfur protein